MNKPDSRDFDEDTTIALPWQEVSLDVLRESIKGAEQRDLDGPDMARAVRRRVARALAAVEATPRPGSPCSSRRWRTASSPAGGSILRQGPGIDEVTLHQLLRAAG